MELEKSSWKILTRQRPWSSCLVPTDSSDSSSPGSSSVAEANPGSKSFPRMGVQHSTHLLETLQGFPSDPANKPSDFSISHPVLQTFTGDRERSAGGWTRGFGADLWLPGTPKNANPEPCPAQLCLGSGIHPIKHLWECSHCPS